MYVVHVSTAVVHYPTKSITAGMINVLGSDVYVCAYNRCVHIHKWIDDMGINN